MKIKNLLKRPLSCTLVLLLFSLSALAQNAIKGTIRSTRQEQLAGATITLKGTNKSVVTDTTGNFTIDAPQGSTLVISSVGFQEKEVKIKGNTLAVELETKVNNLNEVIVTGYGSQKKESLTGAISSVTAKDLDRVHGSTTGVTVHFCLSPVSHIVIGICLHISKSCPILETAICINIYYTSCT